MKKLALGISTVVGGASLYEFAIELLPLGVVVLLAFAGLWYTVRFGSGMVATGLAELDVERPYAVTFGVVAVVFLTSFYVDYLLFDTSIGQSFGRSLPPNIGFYEFIKLRADAGYGRFFSSTEVVAGGWSTLAVWTAWTGFLLLGGFAGAGRALRRRRRDQQARD